MPDFGSHLLGMLQDSLLKMSVKILAIIEKKFFSLLDVLAGVDSNPVIAVHQENSHTTVWLGGMICESDLSSHPEIE